MSAPPCPLRRILIRSERAATVACAQHDPHHFGKNWFRTGVRNEVPLTFPQSQAAGSASVYGRWVITCGGGFHALGLYRATTSRGRNNDNAPIWLLVYKVGPCSLRPCVPGLPRLSHRH
jgi:hypothetical protein